MDFESSSSSSSSSEIVAAATDPKRTRRQKTRHPFFRGVRRRYSGKWVSEVREPNTTSRIWLGTFPYPEMAAVAHDVATLTLHGDAATLNFPDAAHRLPRPTSSSHQDIKRTAIQAARDFTQLSISYSTPLAFSQNTGENGMVESSSIGLDNKNTSSNALNVKDDKRKINVETSSSTSGGVEFVDDEAIYNMPLLLDSMAEGMLLTPPSMKKGFSWGQELDDEIDLTLWRD